MNRGSVRGGSRGGFGGGRGGFGGDRGRGGFGGGRGGPRGGSRGGGRGRGGARGGARGGSKSVVIEKHRHEGIFIVKGKDESIGTLNLVPGVSVYGEKRVSLEVSINGDGIHFFTQHYLGKQANNPNFHTRCNTKDRIQNMASIPFQIGSSSYERC